MLKLYRFKKCIVFVRSGKLETSELLGANHYFGCKWLRVKVVWND